MAPIAKENEIQSHATETTAPRSATASVLADNANKPQPVALEVPVSVNGARTVEGSDKREPFSESTKTVLIFGSGAVIRLSSSVTPGQLLFLTNEKTKKEVVCQVVKSKNYRNVSGYVELEFTESVVGFWGMRFPGDRIGSGPQAVVNTSAALGSPVASVTPAAPRTVAPPAVAPKVEPLPASFAPKIPTQRPVVPPLAPMSAVPPAPKPEVPVAHVPATPASLMPDLAVSAPPVKPVSPISSTFDLPRTPDARASIFSAPPQTQVTPAALEIAGLSSVPGVGPVTAQAPLAPPPSSPSDQETAALKQQAARLQEQLSSMLFMESSAAKPVAAPPAPPAIPTSTQQADVAAKILEFAKPEPAPLPVRAVEAAKVASPPAKSMLDDEELKIPSWLEPLARNAAAPASTQELIEREKSKRLAEQSTVEEIVAAPAIVAEEEHVPELQVPNFGSDLRIDASDNVAAAGSAKSGKGFMFTAIAAGLLIFAGVGYWYFRQQSAGVPAAAVIKPVPAISAPAETFQAKGSAAPQTIPSAQTASAAQGNLPSQASSNSNPAGVTPAGAAYAPVNNKEVIPNPEKSASPLDAAASAQPLPAQPKKPSLGEVRLATPKVTRRGNLQDNGEADAGLAMSGDESDSSSAALGAGLAVNGKQPASPAAPLPVGGDVKPAKLLTRVPPVYPSLARGQHVSGDVLIDALIDPTGHVTTMKIISGPTLLHQAAMDALRQWKYQPATLDDKPVQMHLTVTVQFRLQ
jgi:protein TonB